MNAKTEMAHEVRWSIVASVLMILAGILAIIVPPVTGIAATIFFSWLLIFAGCALLAFAWHARSRGGFWWGVLLGAIYIAAGIYMLMHPVAALASLTLLLASYLFLEAVVEFVLGFRLRPLKGSGWLLFDGIVTLILAALICLTWPASALWVIGTLVGISILFSGTARLMLSLAVRRLARQFPAGLQEAAQAP